MGTASVVIVAGGANINETTYTNIKTAIQNAITTFNANNPGVNLSLDTQNSKYLTIG